MMDVKTHFNIRNVNGWTILSFVVFLAGIMFYLWWGTTYGVWADIGIYSITIVLVLGGLLGLLLSLTRKNTEE